MQLERPVRISAGGRSSSLPNRPLGVQPASIVTIFATFPPLTAYRAHFPQ
jgi:hypothetical protein